VTPSIITSAIIGHAILLVNERVGSGRTSGS